MEKLNVEIKARCNGPENVRQYLMDAGADFKGSDHQIDTYFKVHNGRLKLRQGNIENHLIHYLRSDQEGPKSSEVSLYKPNEAKDLKRTLSKALGQLVVVDKQREIYFIDNVKFHIDSVAGLGSFMEIEAISCPAKPSEADLLTQCQHYMKELSVAEGDLVSNSYSDMLGNG